MARLAISFEGLATGIGRALSALEEQLDPVNVQHYFRTLGLELPDSPAENGVVAARLTSARGVVAMLRQQTDDLSVASGAAQVIGLATALIATTADLKTELDGIQTALVAQAGNLGVPAGVVSAFAAEFPERAFEGALVAGFERHLPGLAAAFIALGVLEKTFEPLLPGQESTAFFPLRSFTPSRLTDALTNPAGVLDALFGFGGPDFGNPTAPPETNGTLLLERIGALLTIFGGNFQLLEFAPGELPTLNTTFGAVTPTTAGLRFTFPISIDDAFELTLPISESWSLIAKVRGDVPRNLPVVISPSGQVTIEGPSGFSPELSVDFSAVPPAGGRFPVLGQEGATRVEVGRVGVGIVLSASFDGSQTTGDVAITASLKDGKAVIALGGGDGFVKSVTGGQPVEASFELGASYGLSSGLRFVGGGALAVTLPLHVSFAGVELNDLQVRFPLGQPGRAGLPFDLATSIDATFGPFSLVVDGIGLKFDLTFGSGNLGVANLEPDVLLPTGIGASIDGPAVSGGGFLSRDPVTGRYAGAIELRVFSIAVKAFGLLDTRFPDGTEGISFVVVITAEFTAIQLGFGFTLLGVGGMLGLNRTFDQVAIGDAIRTGSIAHLLFPTNPVQDAPAIIHDLGTVFPAARGHFIFGPMAKLGWGTPTLISADLGVMIELPGPRILVLGVVRMLLPSQEFALLSLQMAVSGLLDFPAKQFSLDASLFDSVVAGYPVSGDMAYRLGFGQNASFLLSVGGFNPAFDAPPAFPELRRASVDLGMHGNPSLVASGYFALTSNTAQIGASIELNARGAGIRLHGWLGFDVMFVFSPFSFTASISAGMRVSFHGAGFGITLNGSLSGPSPWHLKGKVCVSVLWWDACLSVDETFGSNRPAALPEIDPWFGSSNEDPRLVVRGLQEAIQDARSWSGANPPAGFAVVSLSAAATAETTPIDPLAAAELRQKVAPLELKLGKFGEYKPKDHDEFKLSSIDIDGEEILDRNFLDDAFAPAHFLELSRAERLSMPSYVPMKAGFAVRPDRVSIGSSGTKVLEYETKFITAQGQVFDNQPPFKLTQLQLRGLLKRSAAALGGVQRSGARKYVVPNKPKKVRFGPKTFVVVDTCSSKRNIALTPGEVSQVEALAALRSHVALNPADQGRFRVVAIHAELA